MHICYFSSQKQVEKIMQEIGVDPYGIKIMLPKAMNFLIRINALSNISANILKQEMLSLGGDVAITRGALTGKVKKTDCLIIATFTQLKSLINKLSLQPFGLKKLALEIKENIENYTKNDFSLALRKGHLKLGKRTKIMGIINLTPDSFSQDGLYNPENRNFPDLALKKALKLEIDGADIIDLGGESSRPGAKSISLKEELKRVIPVLKLLVKKIKLPISVDTTKPEVAAASLDAGAQIINDISGLRDKRMIKIIAKYKAAVVIMHMLGKPMNMQKKITYHALIDDILAYLKSAVDKAESAGIKADKIIIDPGIGFGKTPVHNYRILEKLADFKSLGKPILLGPSKKSFIAKTLGSDPESREIGTLATCVIASQRGANILRVHDVKQVNQALKIVEALKNANV